MTHPHRDLIIALLDDPTLEVEQFADCWRNCMFDSQNQAVSFIVQRPNYRFRLREKPKPDVVTECRILGPYKSILWNSVTDTVDRANLRLTFSADGVLKSAEVL